MQAFLDLAFRDALDACDNLLQALNMAGEGKGYKILVARKIIKETCQEILKEEVGEDYEELYGKSS